MEMICTLNPVLLNQGLKSNLQSLYESVNIFAVKKKI